MVTVGWLSWFVENTCDFFVGITVLREISLVITPPTVSIPSVSGVTSRRSKSEPPSPDKIPAYEGTQLDLPVIGLVKR